MAYDGEWREGLQFMAAAYAKVSSVRDGIEAERNLQGFFMAYLNLNPYYYTAPELDLTTAIAISSSSLTSHTMLPNTATFWS